MLKDGDSLSVVVLRLNLKTETVELGEAKKSELKQVADVDTQLSALQKRISAADNADNWLAPVAANVARIKAVRVAVVARSSLKERPSTPGGVCDATPSASAPNYPQWAGGAIDVTKNPDGTANADWMCYRYKVYQTTIPLRNIMWANI